MTQIHLFNYLVQVLVLQTTRLRLSLINTTPHLCQLAFSSRVPLVIAETTHARLSSRDKVRRDRQVVPTTRAIAHFWRLQRDIVSLEICSVAVLFVPSPLLVPRVVEQVVIKVETFDRRRVVASRRQARRLYHRRAMHVPLDRAVLPNARTTSVVVVVITVTSPPQRRRVVDNLLLTRFFTHDRVRLSLDKFRAARSRGARSHLRRRRRRRRRCEAARDDRRRRDPTTRFTRLRVRVYAFYASRTRSLHVRTCKQYKLVILKKMEESISSQSRRGSVTRSSQRRAPRRTDGWTSGAGRRGTHERCERSSNETPSRVAGKKS